MSELGEALKNARMEKDISLDELQETTKIQKRYLRAIESGEYGQLPGRFYARAFIKSYAEAVGLDYDRLLEMHESEVPRPHDDVLEQMPSRSERSRKKPQPVRKARVSGRRKAPSAIFPGILAAIVIVGLFALIWMALQQSGTNPESGSAAQSKNSLEFSKNPAANQQKNKQKADKKQSPSQQTSGKADSQTKPKKQPKKPSKPEPVLKKTGTDNGVTLYTLKNANHFQLKLSVTGGDSWIEVRKSGTDGDKFVYGMVHPGKTITKDLSGNKQIYVKIGSTPHVKMTINGNPFTYPSNDVYQKFLITLQGAKHVS
ncbi:MAG TPA: RodZ domain-containing protein [Bacillales bacterium]|nr:RodZ domain-containing protein [Bacillales bacterium]